MNNTPTTVVVPVFNEKDAVGILLEKIMEMKLHERFTFLFIDDGSDDGSPEVIRRYPVTLLVHSVNKGYGAALKTGIRHAGGKKILFMDGDGQHDPAYLGEMDRLLDNCDMVIGERTEGSFQVYWYEGELEFGQQVLDTAQEGLIQIQNLLPLPVPDPLKIYVYPDAREMQATLDTASAGWVAGHADPELGVIVVALPGGPDQFLLMEQRIPHELMHIALYQATDMGYANLPAWLSEGLAAQVELYPNPDYRVFLSNAIENDSLIPMSNLCQSFPREASNAMVAYAQSESFTRYLYNAYGTPGLDALVTNYANGLDCDHGAKAALGRDLFQLDFSSCRSLFLADAVVADNGVVLVVKVLKIDDLLIDKRAQKFDHKESIAFRSYMQFFA